MKLAILAFLKLIIIIIYEQVVKFALVIIIIDHCRTTDHLSGQLRDRNTTWRCPTCAQQRQPVCTSARFPATGPGYIVTYAKVGWNNPACQGNEHFNNCNIQWRPTSFLPSGSMNSSKPLAYRQATSCQQFAHSIRKELTIC